MKRFVRSVDIDLAKTTLDLLPTRYIIVDKVMKHTKEIDNKGLQLDMQRYIIVSMKYKRKAGELE